MKITASDRGFQRIYLPVYVKHPPTIVGQSSAVGDYEDALDRPGSSFLWVGNAHLNREQVAEFVDHLTQWMATGSLE